MLKSAKLLSIQCYAGKFQRKQQYLSDLALANCCAHPRITFALLTYYADQNSITQQTTTSISTNIFKIKPGQLVPLDFIIHSPVLEVTLWTCGMVLYGTDALGVDLSLNQQLKVTQSQTQPVAQSHASFITHLLRAFVLLTGIVMIEC